MNEFDQYAYQWGDVLRYFKKGHSYYYIYKNSLKSAIRYSKKYEGGKYWYSIVPAVIDDYKRLDINSHIFCFSDVGSVNLPIQILYEYLKTAKTTPKNGDVKKYHIRIEYSEINQKCCLYTSGMYNKDISEYLKLFKQGISETVENDLNSLITEKDFEEGKKNNRIISYFERNPILREAAIRIHSTKCKVCGFDFNEFYGEIGKDFIEVHHIKPVSNYTSQHTINPASDLVVLCSNCHRMIHRNKDKVLSVDELKEILREKRKYSKKIVP